MEKANCKNCSKSDNCIVERKMIEAQSRHSIKIIFDVIYCEYYKLDFVTECPECGNHKNFTRGYIWFEFNGVKICDKCGEVIFTGKDFAKYIFENIFVHFWNGRITIAGD